MADFYQSDLIITLHRLGSPGIERIEHELMEYSRQRPIALVLPALVTEFQGEAIKGIVAELMKVKYIREVILTLGRANDREFRDVREFMSQLPCEVKIVHNEGKRVKEIYATLERNNVWAGEDGKGRSAWIAYGYVIANAQSEVIALHDCDIITYNRGMLARLCYPVANPNIDVVFCKGFYSRITDKMHGRVTRLLITPLIRAMQKLVGPNPFLMFMDSFRYPLAGEFAMITDMARTNRIPWDWGLEVGVLSEVFRNYSPHRVCQVDIADNYEHKHQQLSADDANKGLMRMSVDICKAMFRFLAAEGIVLSDSFFKSLQVAYIRLAEDTMVKYEADAAINGLKFDRHSEAVAAEAFSNAIKIASEAYSENPMAAPLIPNWNRVTSAIPGILDMLKKAVDEDNR